MSDGRLLMLRTWQECVEAKFVFCIFCEGRVDRMCQIGKLLGVFFGNICTTNCMDSRLMRPVKATRPEFEGLGERSGTNLSYQGCYSRKVMDLFRPLSAIDAQF